MKISYQSMYKTIMTLLIWASVLILAGYLLFQPDISTNQKEKSYLIGASYMTMNNEFYEILNEQISHRVEAEGDRIILRDPALSVRRQQEQIEMMLEEGISVLILTPVDADGLSDVLKKAHETLVDCTIVSDNYKAGCLLGEYLMRNKDSSRVVIMTHETATSGRERVQGFLDTIQGSDKITVVRKVPCEGQLEVAMPKMEKIIEAGTRFDSVFCLNDPASLGVAAALDSNGLLDSVDIYGVDASPDAKQLIDEGKMKASVAQFPSQIGEEAANAIYDLLEGKEVERYISVPVELVTKENVEQYNVDRWQ